MEGINGRGRIYPTTLRLPLWARGLALGPAIRSFRVSEPRVRVISPTFIKERGLTRALAFPGFRPALDPMDVLMQVKAERPLIPGEIVEWMQISGAENAVLQARAQEYNRLGSEIATKSGDPYLPGVSVQDVYFPSRTRGADVRSLGYAIASTPRGDFRVPALGKSSGVFRDLISWGSAPKLYTGQWVGNLIKWISLAETPIRQTVGFYKDSKGNAAPNFFVQQPTRPALTVTVRQRISSDKEQTIGINFRDPTNYANVMGSKSVAVATGENEVVYSLSAFPYVPPTVAELQPQDGTSTKLEEYTVA